MDVVRVSPRKHCVYYSIVSEVGGGFSLWEECLSPCKHKHNPDFLFHCRGMCKCFVSKKALDEI